MTTSTSHRHAIGTRSTHMQSACCNALVVSTYDFPMDLYNVHCGACSRILARPTGRDIWTLQLGDLPPEQSGTR